MPKPRFGTVGQERVVLDRIRTMREAGSALAEIAEALTEAGYRTRAGTPHSVATVSRVLIECDDVRRTVEDLKKQATMLKTTISKFRMLESVDRTPQAAVDSVSMILETNGLGEVEAIRAAVGVA